MIMIQIDSGKMAVIICIGFGDHDLHFCLGNIFQKVH